MALRVLLADESTTIKKVMQLALQDFAVEVKTVHSGVDVVEVARSFQPDIIFADVLLQKRNGYDVCGDVKKDTLLRNIPVVLMWSSFMDLDERAYINAKANGKLEKPFDVENLRSLILELVPKTQSQRLAHFLHFPNSFVEPMEKEEGDKQRNSHEPKQSPAAANAPLQQRPAPGPAATPSVSPTMTPTPASTPTPPPPEYSISSPGSHLGSRATPQSPNQSPSDSPNVSASTSMSGVTPPPFSPGSVSAGPTPAASNNWNMDSFESISKFSDSLPDSLSDSLPDSLEIDPSEISSPAINDDDEYEPMQIAKLGGGGIKPAPPRPEQPSDDMEPWSHQDLARFKLDIPQEDVETDEISLVFDMNEHEVPVDGTEFLLNSKKPNENTLPFTLSGAEEKAQKEAARLNDLPSESRQQDRNSRSHRPDDGLQDLPVDLRIMGDAEFTASRHQPIGELQDFDGEAISQFAAPEPHEEEILSSLSLDQIPEDQASDQMAGPSMGRFGAESESGKSGISKSGISAAGSIPSLSEAELERIIRAQSKEIIEAVVQRIVPDIATELIQKEIERLLKESNAGETPRGGSSR